MRYLRDAQKLLIIITMIGLFPLASQEGLEDTGKLRAKKIGFDIRIGLNQASTGGILHLTEWLAFNPYALYRSEESTNNYVVEPTSGSSSTYNTSKESFFGVGGYLPIYVARIEDLHVRLMPGFSYMGGKLSRSQLLGSTTIYDQSANMTRISYQLLIGLQYALNKHLHVFGETGYNYSEYKAGFYTSKVGNFYSGNIGLVFYLN